jgi:hypothetical protein
MARLLHKSHQPDWHDLKGQIKKNDRVYFLEKNSKSRFHWN